MATLRTLVEDGLSLVGASELHRVVLQLWMLALGASLLDDGANTLLLATRARINHIWLHNALHACRFQDQ